MNQPTKKLLIRIYLVGAAYTVVGLLILNFVSIATGMNQGLEHTTGEGIFAFYFTFLFIAIGAFYLVMVRWMPHPDLDGWIPAVLVGALGFAMIAVFAYLGPSIPVPD